jgi:diadenosine tetraphosphate (Ap4A) HIT family hydrolase
MRHVRSFFELSALESQSLLELLNFTQKNIDSEFKPDGYNIGINDGAVAG